MQSQTENFKHLFKGMHAQVHEILRFRDFVALRLDGVDHALNSSRGSLMEHQEQITYILEIASLT